ncbi:fimbrin-1 [Anaeramoeba ignava]|uniref:Fimbrin-1 n=1 Tax=Anaeramoeba ignava TaxID=1746090 RepID=A0A9Q0L8D2_ANAIG|nr:fimbrin-1 [Anaeramoeba ignava]
MNEKEEPKVSRIKRGIQRRSQSIFKKPPKTELPRFDLEKPQLNRTIKTSSRSISMLDVQKINEKTSSVRQKIKNYLQPQFKPQEENEQNEQQQKDAKRLYGKLAKDRSPRTTRNSKQVHFAVESTPTNSPLHGQSQNQSQNQSQEVIQLRKQLEDKEKELRTVAELGLLVSKENKALIAEIEDLQNQLLNHEEDENMQTELQEIIDELEAEKAELTKKNQHLGRQIEEASKTNYSYLQQINQYEEDIEDFKKSDKQLSRLKLENTELKNEIDNLQLLKNQIKTMSEEKQDLKQQISKLEVDKTYLLKSNSELNDQIDLLNVDYDSLKLELTNLQTQGRKSNQYQIEIQQLKTQLDWMEKFTVSSTKLAETAETIIEIHVKDIMDQADEEKKMNEEAKRTISFLVHKLPLHFKKKTLEENKKFFEDEFHDTDSDSDDINSDSDFVENDNVQNGDDFGWFELDIDKGNEENGFLTLYEDSRRKLIYLSYLLVFGKLYLDMETQKNISEKEKNELHEEIQELQRKLKQEIEKNNNLEQILHKKLNESESGMNELQKENARKIQLLNDELNKSKENEKKLQKDLNASEENNRQLQNQIEELKQSLENQKQLTERQQNLNDSLKKQFEEKQKEMEERFQKEKEEFENKIKNLLANIQKLEEEKKNLDNLINGKYQFEIDDYKFKIKQLGDKIQELNDVLKTQENKFKKEIEENNEKYEDEIKSLNKKLEQEKNSNEKLEEQIKFLKKQLEDEEKMRKKLEEQKKELETNLQIANARANAEYQEKKSLEEENVKLEKEIKKLRAEIAELKKKLEEALSKEPQVVIKEISIPVQSEPEPPEREIDLLEQSMIEYINFMFKYDRDLIHILPMGVKTLDLISASLDGILLCKLINHAIPGTIDERVINMNNPSEEQIMENIVLCLNSAKSIGCNVIGMKAEEIMKGEETTILNLAWEITKMGLLSNVSFERHPELIQLCVDKETIEDIQKLSPEDVLLKWFNYHLKKAGHLRRVSNFNEDIRDSENIAVLLHQLSPKRCPIQGFIEESDFDVRAELVVANAAKLNCKFFISTRAIVSGQYEQLNLAFLANLFHTRSGLQATQQEISKTALQYDKSGTREERAFRIWINSMGIEPKVNNLYEDLKDGIILLKVLDHIEPGCVSWKRVNLHPPNIYKKLENCNYVVDIGKKLGLHLVNISGNNIHEGNKTLVLGYVWQAMEYHIKSILTKLKVIQSGKITDSVMVKWANEKVSNAGKKTQIRNFRDRSIRNGIFFVDLVYAIKPQVVNYSFVQDGSSDSECMNNALYAISLCRKIGAEIFVIPEDIVEVKPKMLLTVVGELMRVYKEIHHKN